MQIGKRIKDLRVQKGLTQEEVSLRAGGIRQNYLSMIERDARSPSLDVLLKIASALDVHVTELLGYPDDAKVIALPSIKLLSLSEDELDEKLDEAGGAEELWALHRKIRIEEGEIEAALIFHEHQLKLMQALKDRAPAYRTSVLSAATMADDPTSKAPVKKTAQVRAELAELKDPPVGQGSREARGGRVDPC